jgi:hypothetical protein
MKISVLRFLDEVAKLRYEVAGWDTKRASRCFITDITETICDPQKENMVDVLTIKVEMDLEAADKDDGKMPTQHYGTLEIFPDSDKKESVMTTNKTVKLIPKT